MVRYHLTSYLRILSMFKSGYEIGTQMFDRTVIPREKTNNALLLVLCVPPTGGLCLLLFSVRKIILGSHTEYLTNAYVTVRKFAFVSKRIAMILYMYSFCVHVLCITNEYLYVLTIEGPAGG